MRKLSTPLKLKHHTLRNRIIMGSMHTGFEEHPEGFPHLAAFYQQRAEGGVALIITGGISPNAAGAIIEGGAELSNVKDVERHRLLTDAVHQHGAKICLQILHAGRYAMSRQPVAPSAIRAPINQATPRAMTLEEIQATIADYAHCAQLAQQAGYDGVEIMGSEGYLINQFLAPATNQRDDDYGGSRDNRQRFAVAIVKAIRHAVGEEFLLIFRLSLMDLVPHGSTWEDNVALVAKLEDAGIDLFNSGIGWHEARIPTIATCVPRAAFSAATAKLKSISNLPVIATNRINMPTTAETILQNQEADAVCLARPFLADAHWANKAIGKHDETIAPCIACNQACLDHLFAGRLASCLVNPFACHELQMPFTRSHTPKKIAIVGAGASGISCALVAAARGHHVTLMDAADSIGGQLNIAKNIPGKPEFGTLLDYYEHQLKNASNIDLQLQKKVNAKDLQDFDEIVIATGILPRRLEIPGADLAKVVNYIDVLTGKITVGSSVAIIGSGGIGFDTAEFLSQSGRDTSLDKQAFLTEWQIDRDLAQPGALTANHPAIAPSPRQIYLLQRKSGMVGAGLGKTTGWIHRLVLKERGIKMLAGVSYQKIDPKGLHIEINGEKQCLAVDHIVVCAGQISDNRLAEACQSLNRPVHIIGGAKDARALDAKRAILQGTELALEL